MSDYPMLWKRGLIQARVRELANHRCEECGMEFQPGTNLAITERNRNGHAVIGTVHHIDENKANCAMSNLVYLCQRCHYRIHLYGWQPGKPLPICWHDEIPGWLSSRFPDYEPIYERRLL